MSRLSVLVVALVLVLLALVVIVKAQSTFVLTTYYANPDCSGGVVEYWYHGNVDSPPSSVSSTCNGTGAHLSLVSSIPESPPSGFGGIYEYTDSACSSSAAWNAFFISLGTCNTEVIGTPIVMSCSGTSGTIAFYSYESTTCSGSVPDTYGSNNCEVQGVQGSTQFLCQGGAGAAAHSGAVYSALAVGDFFWLFAISLMPLLLFVL